MKRFIIILTLLLTTTLPSSSYAQVDMKPLVEFPKVESGKPAAGKFVAVTEPEYKGTEVRHMIYLPSNYKKGKKYPLIVEYTGNKWNYGTGEVEEAHLGFSATLGKDFIWVVLPYISPDHTTNQVKWWGDEKATTEYAQMVIPKIIKEYNGDKDNVILCGFSRGAIGVSYLGLYDDKTASLWSAFFTHDHFDGYQEWRGQPWGSPLDKFRAEATIRLKRAKGKPWFISTANSGVDFRSYIKLLGVDKDIDFTYNEIPVSKYFEIPNQYFKHSHTDCWAAFNTPESKKLRDWLRLVTQAN